MPAAWRLLDLIGELRPAHRPGHPHQVPDLLRAAPPQGGLADAPVPGRLRPLRHRVRRLRPPRRGHRGARAHPDLDREMLGECAAVYTISQTTSDRLHAVQRRAVDSRSTTRRPWRRGCARARMATISCRWGGSRPSSGSNWPSRRMAHVPAPTRLLVAGEGTFRHGLERRIEELGLGDRVTLARERRRSRR